MSSPERSLGRKRSERLLHRDQDFPRVCSQAGDVQQHEQHAGRPHAQEFIEIASHPLPAVHRGNLGLTQFGCIAMQRVSERQYNFTRLKQRTPEPRRGRQDSPALGFRIIAHPPKHGCQNA